MGYVYTSMNQKTCKAQEEDGDSKSKNAPAPILAIDARESEKHAPEGKGQCEKAAPLHQVTRWDRFKKWLSGITIGEVGMLILTGVIATSTYYYTKYASGQWNAMERGLTQQQSHFSTTERAWVSVSATSFMYVKDEQGIPRADSIIKFMNTGPSPAFNIHIWRCSQVRESEPSLDAGPSGTPPCLGNDLGILGTNILLSFEMPDRTQAVAKGSLPKNPYAPGRHLYVWGKITYDIFSKDGRHFTNFCLLNANTQLAPCSKGNNAD